MINKNEKQSSQMVIVIDDSKYRVLPKGFYNAELIDVRIEDGNYGQRFKFVFKIISEVVKGDLDHHSDVAGCCFDNFANVNDSVCSNSKLARLIRALGVTENRCALGTLCGKSCFVDLSQDGHINKANAFYSRKEME